MRIVPDNACVEQRVPGTKSELIIPYWDTIELDFRDEFLKFCFKERLVGTWGDTNIRDVPEIIEAFIKAKLDKSKEKRK